IAVRAAFSLSSAVRSSTGTLTAAPACCASSTARSACASLVLARGPLLEQPAASGAAAAIQTSPVPSRRIVCFTVGPPPVRESSAARLVRRRHRTPSDVGPRRGEECAPQTVAGLVPRRSRRAIAKSHLAEGAVDSGDQGLIVEGLAEVQDGAGAARAILRRCVVVGSDEHHRNAPAGGHEALVQLEPAEPAEVDVEDQAAGRVGALALEEVLGRREGLDLEAAGAEEASKGPEQRDVVVDHAYERRAVVLAGGSGCGCQAALSLRYDVRACDAPPPCVVGPIRAGRLAGIAGPRGRSRASRRRAARHGV